MANRWGAPFLLVGLAVLAVERPAQSGYFGITNYATNTPPTTCAQTHFVTACEDTGIQVVKFELGSGKNPVPKLIDKDPSLLPTLVEVDAPGSTEPAPNLRPGLTENSLPNTQPMPGSAPEMAGRPVYETVPRTVTEIVYKPVCETVMKECRSIVRERVCETHYKQCSVNVCKPVREAVAHSQCFQVSKPVCETVYKECSHTVCKPITETHYRECPQTVCKSVTETAIRESSRVVMRDVTETVCQDVCKTVSETVTCNRAVVKLVPETVCETVCVPGGLVWRSVPKYECAFDPCTCCTCQKQVGTTRKLVREPSSTVTRQVTRNKTVVEEIPETKVIQKTVVEKVPITVTKKVHTVVCDRVPVTTTRTIATKEMVKVPYTVTRSVPIVEVTKEPVIVHRKALGAYVEVASLTPEAAAQAARGVEFLPGGPALLKAPTASTYELSGPGRVFVEGLTGKREVTFFVTKTVTVTEIKAVPYQVTRTIEKEVTKMVPTTVTRMVPTTVTKVVPVATCRIVKEEVAPVATACPDLCKRCPQVYVIRECPRTPSTGSCQSCGPVCPPTSGSPCSCSVIGTWLHRIYDNAQRFHPIREFFCQRHTKCLSSSPCTCDPCATSTAPSTTPPATPPKATTAPLQALPTVPKE